MKEVIAIIRPGRWLNTRSRLEQLGIPGCAHHRVLGKGSTQGLRYLSPAAADAQVGVRFLPKRMLSCVVADDMAQPLVQALIEVNQTGQLGDGKIFVLPLEREIRIDRDKVEQEGTCERETTLLKA